MHLVVACAVASLDDIRVYSIRPACFAYKFTSIVTKKSSGFVFSLNHLSGTTHFVEIGDHVGPYLVKSYEPDSKHVYRKSLKAYKTVKSGSLMLEDYAGRITPLILNEIMSANGRMVGLVSLETGRKQFARQSDGLVLNGSQLRVIEIKDNTARIFNGGVISEVQMISDAETETLKRMRAERACKQAQDAELAREVRAQKTEQFEDAFEKLAAAGAVRRPQKITWPTRTSPMRFVYGSTCPMPVAYQVLPIRGRLPSGRLGYQPMTVPTRFRRYHSGFSIFCGR